MNWVAGYISGVFTISSGGVLNLGGAGEVTQYAALTNSGHITGTGRGIGICTTTARRQLV